MVIARSGNECVTNGLNEALEQLDMQIKYYFKVIICNTRIWYSYFPCCSMQGIPVKAGYKVDIYFLQTCST